MIDLISRQAAIDAVLDRMDIEKHGRNAKPEEIRWALEKLPPVRPTLMRSIGKLIGYTGEPCPNCGRLRVERYESGLEICEKCNWCEQTKSYWLDWEEE